MNTSPWTYHTTSPADLTIATEIKILVQGGFAHDIRHDVTGNPHCHGRATERLCRTQETGALSAWEPEAGRYT